MGNPKRHRKKYSTPAHPWQRARIEEERELSKEYGFKNKKEMIFILNKNGEFCITYCGPFKFFNLFTLISCRVQCDSIRCIDLFQTIIKNQLIGI